MYQCRDCGCIFDECNRVFDNEVGYLSCCPSCGCDGVVHVYACEICGEYSDDTRYGACPACYETMKKKVDAFTGHMTDAEYDVFIGVLSEG